eukprot:CAMPEP_0201227980 /NCGR_PEP_ID=MMETSP0851-20130426/195395_1 /ASSEMBLY_ACC=CAM_ASM_000631 /TAXON_ID=183588 /ORGANISM="Pseudo-nitzschia fraudulenta, Strain WWA7" /LENGTH=407 /DNA_ID=CAMNT_0047517767 /DNA_START=135 /DNA_END=1358 /DNA_ORIENTATION=-
MAVQSPKKLLPYQAPSFARHFKNAPNYRLRLANLPTPLQDIVLSNCVACTENSVLQPLRDLNIQLLVKRDDMTAGVELGGNKIRKLEFLLADAQDGDYDSVITIGGEQSNHCRATATACRMVGLEPHLILRTKRANEVEKNKEEDSFGYVGNILFDRLAGAAIHTCTPGEYGRVGSNALIEALSEDLASKPEEKERRKAYKIPVGGSNGLGTWGYIEAVDELMQQLDEDDDKIDHVVFACGSGGTAAGIGLGLSLAYREKNDIDNLPKVHAVGVCDYPDYFYETISFIAKEMGLEMPESRSLEEFVRESIVVHQGKGRGYASSTSEELDFIVKFALETGISLDPVYSGKALFQFMNAVKDDPQAYRNSRIMFWHTGGSLGNYEKIEALSGKLESVSPVERMNVYGRK